jgi:hypothetical protein
MAKRRRGSHVAAPPVAGAEAVLADIHTKLGVGVLVESIDPGPPVRITALLTYAALSTRVGVQSDTEPEAWRELARAAAGWRQSNEVSLITNWGM